jgi:hypothetical protein
MCRALLPLHCCCARYVRLQLFVGCWRSLGRDHHHMTPPDRVTSRDARTLGPRDSRVSRVIRVRASRDVTRSRGVMW